MAAFLEEAWWPLLVYMQEIYGYPIRFDRLDTTGITSASKKEEVIFKVKNFSYGRPQTYPLNESRVYQGLTSDGGVKPGVTTTLTVRIPKSRSHSFWDPTQDKLFSWDLSEDALSFEVTRWGPSEPYSNFRATQRAKDIIRNIRLAVSNSTHLDHYTSKDIHEAIYRPFHMCSALRLGAELNQTWKNYKLAFSTICTEQTVDFVVNFIQDKIDSCSCANIIPVLRYYQVYPITVDQF
jgi:hypothetical protein